MSDTAVFDVVVVGAGVVGCAVARELSLRRTATGPLLVALLDANRDVGSGTSKANTAILHTGFDATPGTLEARLVPRGYELLSAYAPSAGVSVEHTGAVLVAWDDEQAATLPRLRAKAIANGYERTEIVDATTAYEMEPHLGPGVTGAMVVPDEHIIDPWGTPLAFAEQAAANSCALLLGWRVVAARRDADTTLLTTDDGRAVRARHVVNAAGLHGDTLHRALGLDGFTIRPRRGELIVFDKLARPLVRSTVLPVPTATTKGVLVAPTVFGNVMLGPTADDIDDRGATGSTRAGLDGLLAKGRRIVPALLDEEVTAVYAGLRPASEHSDYQVSVVGDLGYVCLGAIRSTGLTASMALAEHTVELLASIGLATIERDDAVTIHRTPLGEADPRPYQQGGRIVCHCERVTADEITAACAGPLPAVDLDGLRRRTRAIAGRCQGFHCLAEVSALTGWQVDR
ncbi:MAG: NAD(P)/FAD-dependent oxidoreductase [Actinomycetota bacterium]